MTFLRGSQNIPAMRSMTSTGQDPEGRHERAFARWDEFNKTWEAIETNLAVNTGTLPEDLVRRWQSPCCQHSKNDTLIIPKYAVVILTTTVVMGEPCFIIPGSL